MKDAILKTLDNELDGLIEVESSERASAMIAELMIAFIKWLIDEQEIFLGDLSERYITNDNISINGKTSLTMDEIFAYWHTEIYKNNNHGRRN